MVQTLRCEPLALVKLLLHAAKYSSSTINGILLGQIGNGQDIYVSDIIPLFHTATNLAMPLEVALSLAEAYTAKSEGKVQIVGYYHSEARLAAAELTPVARKVADKLSTKQPASVVLLLDNKKLAAFLSGEVSQHPFELFTQKDGNRGWKHDAPSQVVVVESSSWQVVSSSFDGLFKASAHTTLVDFDNHLDDVSKDFLNAHIKV